jgi:hypothetical protein
MQTQTREKIHGRGRPPRMVIEAAHDLRDELDVLRKQSRTCPRCDGEGYRDDEPGWKVTDEAGRCACYRCNGAGTLPPRKYADPLKVRYAVANRLKPAVERKNVDFVRSVKREILDGDNWVYWPVLEDVFKAAEAAIHGER